MLRPLLSLHNVHKSFGPPTARVEVLRDIELRVKQGEFVAIVGYSGAGKTTLISLIAGLIKPDQGQILLNGNSVTEPGPDRGVVFQNYSLLPWLTVFENIQLAVDQVFPNWPAERQRAQVDQYIATVNLTAARGKKPGELSGGMRQRVAVARALATEPQILLLDEPLGALDALTRATLQNEIIAIWERDRRTVIMITNDVDEAILMADRIVPLSAGPNATLGPGFEVGLPRPRDYKTINHLSEYKEVRRKVIGYLLGEGGKQRTSVTKTLILPDLLPEDLSEPRTLNGARRKPRRRSEQKRETVEVE